jgi:septal ring factor EnvC (AmiA/AmiB activator)|tara:strand:+ start:24 stop:365 length:342 start_codon:yes stop_codon:yes gene_type:complete
MDIGALKTFLPIAILGITGLIALVKVKARADGTYQDMVGVRKDLDRLEKEAADWSRTTVKLVAQLEQAEKNITALWNAHENVLSKHDSARDRLDDRFTSLRDRFGNGDKSGSK